MKRQTKKLLAYVISVVMIIGMFPLIALAEWQATDDEDLLNVKDGVDQPENYVTSENELPANEGGELQEMWVLVDEYTEQGKELGKHIGGFDILDVSFEKVYKEETKWVGGYDMVQIDVTEETAQAGYVVLEDMEDSGDSSGQNYNGLALGQGNTQEQVEEEMAKWDFSFDEINNPLVITVPSGVTITLRIQVDKDEYKYVEVSGPTEYARDGQNWWIHEIRDNKTEVPVYEEQWVDELYQQVTKKLVGVKLVVDKEWNKEKYWIHQGYEEIMVQIFQRFVWVPGTGGGDPITNPIIDPDDEEDGYFIEIETGETFTSDEVIALFVPTLPEGGGTIIPRVLPEILMMESSIPLAAPAEADDEITIDEPEVPLAPGPQDPSGGPYLWLLTLLLLLLLIPLWRRRRTVEYITGANEEPYTEKVKYGSYLEKPEKQIPNAHMINAWFKDSDYNEKWNFENDKIKKNTQLYAKYDR